uniref:Putative secreted peptide n=1 Tax=Anopheles braziliensis TaxID=58242 RepID=A0A2M3ZTU9_9DIPT
MMFAFAVRTFFLFFARFLLLMLLVLIFDLLVSRTFCLSADGRSGGYIFTTFRRSALLGVDRCPTIIVSIRHRFLFFFGRSGFVFCDRFPQRHTNPLYLQLNAR